MQDFLLNWFPVIIAGCAGASMGQEFSFDHPGRNGIVWMAAGFVGGAVAFYAIVFTAVGGKV